MSPVAYSSRSFSSRAEPSESQTYEGFSVQDADLLNRPRPRGFQRSEVRELKHKVETATAHEPGEVSVGTASCVGSNQSHHAPPSRPNVSSQSSPISPKIQDSFHDRTSHRQAKMLSTAPHAKKPIMGPSDSTRTLGHRKDASLSASGESSSMEVITNEQKLSCWARGASAESAHPQPAGKLGGENGSSWIHPDLDDGKPIQMHRSRADLSKLPMYHFPGAKKKLVDTAQSSFERQKAYVNVSKGKNDSQEIDEVVKLDGPRDASPLSDAVMPLKPSVTVVRSGTLRNADNLFVPPHRRLDFRKENLGVPKRVPQSEDRNDAAQAEASKSQCMLTEMKVSLPSHLHSSASREATERSVTIAAKSDLEYVASEKPLPLTVQSQAPTTQSSTPSIALPSRSSNSLKLPPQALITAPDLHPSAGEPRKTAMAPHHRVQNPTNRRNATGANEASIDRPDNVPKPALPEVVTEAYTSGSVFGYSVVLKDVTDIAQAEDRNPELSGKPTPISKSLIRSPPKGRATSVKKPKKPERELFHYETTLVDYTGNFAPAPIGEEWQMRDKYVNPDVRLAVLQEFAEDQAIDPQAVTPFVDVHSPNFLAGDPVMGDKPVDEVDFDDTNRPPLPVKRMNSGPTKAYKTTEDAIREFTERASKSVASQDPPEMRLTREQKRMLKRSLIESERNFVPPPNPHAPEANIYLRPAEINDTRQVTDIWNHYVRTSAAVPVVQPDEQLFWRNSISEAYDDKLPFIVAVLIGEKASRNLREVRRLKQEHIVGFARATDLGFASNAYRYTVEIEFYVQDGHLHKGIGKTLFDRMMAALAIGYQVKEGAPFLCTDGIERWDGGGHRIVKTILFNILYHDDDKDLGWKKKWLESEDFQQCGLVPNIAYKLSKP